MNVGDLLSIAAQIVPERTATILGDRRTKYGDLDGRASALASGLIEIGVTPGDRVGWMDVNGDRQVEAAFAIARADAVSVPINYRARDDELAFVIEDSGVKVLFVGPQYVAAVGALLSSQGERLGALKTLVAIEGEPAEGWSAYEAHLVPDDTPAPARDGEDTAMILYTAGTTGRPKGVMLTHEALTSYPLENVNPADPDYAQTTLLSVPLYHVAGVQVLFSSIYGGRTLVIEPQFEPGSWLRLVEQESVTRATVVPTMLKMAIEHPDFSSTDLSSLQILTYGAAPMPLDVITSAMKGEGKSVSAGLPSLDPESRVRLVEGVFRPLGEVGYGLRRGQQDLRDAVLHAIAAQVAAGTYERLRREYGLPLDLSPFRD